YIFFHDEPRKQFLQYIESLDIPHVAQDDTMGMIVAIPEELGEDIEDEIEAHYDKLMEDAEAGEAAEKDVAAMTISLQSGDTIYASVEPKGLNRILSVITTQELNDPVNSIVSSVETPDERPFCNR
ncbi:MAG: hypothetical protein ABF326_02015, partial [Arenicellales bacterium]